MVMIMKKLLIGLLLIGSCFLLYYFLYPSENNEILSDKKKAKESSDDILEMMKKMSLEEKIAQMIIVYYASDTVDGALLERLRSTSIGGVILMKENITTYEKTKKFVDDVRNNSKIPPIISIDQEGGNVQRLLYLQDQNPTEIPYMFDVGKTSDEKLAYDIGAVMAEELRTLGVNVCFAPVLDIYSNPNNPVIGKRSFGEDKSLVSKMGISLGKGLEDSNVIPVYKHFPGHGDTVVDSHYDLPIIHKSYEAIKELELYPFEQAIKNDAKIIMIGHLAFPEIIGDDTPTSLSKKMITDILKNEMGYQGLVITDALNMKALTSNYTHKQIYTMAIDAGVDLLLMPEGSGEAIQLIKENVSEKRIDESVYKILQFKMKYLNENHDLDVSYLGSDEHRKVIERIYSN